MQFCIGVTFHCFTKYLQVRTTEEREENDNSETEESDTIDLKEEDMKYNADFMTNGSLQTFHESTIRPHLLECGNQLAEKKDAPFLRGATGVARRWFYKERDDETEVLNDAGLQKVVEKKLNLHIVVRLELKQHSAKHVRKHLLTHDAEVHDNSYTSRADSSSMITNKLEEALCDRFGKVGLKFGPSWGAQIFS
ncbi:hypothetical protein DIPPA_31583 [Diplonema papillatum]|nr:hypothetical protein DIPPA_31583 [Diplonema papillatum]